MQIDTHSFGLPFNKKCTVFSCYTRRIQYVRHLAKYSHFAVSEMNRFQDKMLTDKINQTTEKRQNVQLIFIGLVMPFYLFFEINSIQLKKISKLSFFIRSFNEKRRH